MSVARVRMVNFSSEEEAQSFQEKYIYDAPELITEAEQLLLINTSPDSVLSVAIYSDDKMAEIGLNKIDAYLKDRSQGIKDSFHLEGEVTLKHCHPH